MTIDHHTSDTNSTLLIFQHFTRIAIELCFDKNKVSKLPFTYIVLHETDGTDIVWWDIAHLFERIIVVTYLTGMLQRCFKFQQC